MFKLPYSMNSMPFLFDFHGFQWYSFFQDARLRATSMTLKALSQGRGKSCEMRALFGIKSWQIHIQSYKYRGSP